MFPRDPNGMDAFSLEQFLINPTKWGEDQTWKEVVPKAIVNDLVTNEDRIPIGLGKHPKHGWFVLGTGQGPFIIWTEWDK